jgi:hypothetical protein
MTTPHVMTRTVSGMCQTLPTHLTSTSYIILSNNKYADILFIYGYCNDKSRDAVED